MERIIAENINFLLFERQITTKELAIGCSLSDEYISDILSAIIVPSVKDVERISEFLGVPTYWLFVPLPNFLSTWHITIEELGEMVANNPSLRGFMLGYMAESKIRSYFMRHPEISDIYKPDDHDRNSKYDLVLTYKGHEFTFEIKSLQTNTVRVNGSFMHATFQCDASDKRPVLLPNGHVVNTTCLKFGDFDIVAVNLFAFTKNWDYAFALNRDLPHASQGRGKYKIPEEDLAYLIKSSIPIAYPIQTPFVDNPFVLMDRLLLESD